MWRSAVKSPVLDVCAVSIVHWESELRRFKQQYGQLLEMVVAVDQDSSYLAQQFSNLDASLNAALLEMTTTIVPSVLMKEWHNLQYLTRKNFVDIALGMNLSEASSSFVTRNTQELYALALETYALMLDLELCELSTIQCTIRLAQKCGDFWTFDNLVAKHGHQFSKMYKAFTQEIATVYSHQRYQMLVGLSDESPRMLKEATSSHVIATDITISLTSEARYFEVFNILVDQISHLLDSSCLDKEISDPLVWTAMVQSCLTPTSTVRATGPSHSFIIQASLNHNHGLPASSSNSTVDQSMKDEKVVESNEHSRATRRNGRPQTTDSTAGSLLPKESAHNSQEVARLERLHGIISSKRKQGQNIDWVELLLRQDLIEQVHLSDNVGDSTEIDIDAPISTNECTLSEMIDLESQNRFQSLLQELSVCIPRIVEQLTQLSQWRSTKAITDLTSWVLRLCASSSLSSTQFRSDVKDSVRSDQPELPATALAVMACMRMCRLTLGDEYFLSTQCWTFGEELLVAESCLESLIAIDTEDVHDDAHYVLSVIGHRWNSVSRVADALTTTKTVHEHEIRLRVAHVLLSYFLLRFDLDHGSPDSAVSTRWQEELVLLETSISYLVKPIAPSFRVTINPAPNRYLILSSNSISSILADIQLKSAKLSVLSRQSLGSSAGPAADQSSARPTFSKESMLSMIDSMNSSNLIAHLESCSSLEFFESSLFDKPLFVVCIPLSMLVYSIESDHVDEAVLLWESLLQSLSSLSVKEWQSKNAIQIIPNVVKLLAADSVLCTVFDSSAGEHRSTSNNRLINSMNQLTIFVTQLSSRCIECLQKMWSSDWKNVDTGRYLSSLSAILDASYLLWQRLSLRIRTLQLSLSDFKDCAPLRRILVIMWTNCSKAICARRLPVDDRNGPSLTFTNAPVENLFKSLLPWMLFFSFEVDCVTAEEPISVDLYIAEECVNLLLLKSQQDEDVIDLHDGDSWCPSSVWSDISCLLVLSLSHWYLFSSSRVEESEVVSSIPDFAMSELVAVFVQSYVQIVQTPYFLFQYSDKAHEFLQTETNRIKHRTKYRMPMSDPASSAVPNDSLPCLSEHLLDAELYLEHIRSYFQCFETVGMLLLNSSAVSTFDRQTLSSPTLQLNIQVSSTLENTLLVRKELLLSAMEREQIMDIVFEGFYVRFDMQLTQLVHIVVQPELSSNSSAAKLNCYSRWNHQQVVSTPVHTGESDVDSESFVDNNDFESVVAVSLPAAWVLLDTDYHRSSICNTVWNIFLFLQMAIDSKTINRNQSRECFLWLLHLPLLPQVEETLTEIDSNEQYYSCSSWIHIQELLLHNFCSLCPDIQRQLQLINGAVLSTFSGKVHSFCEGLGPDSELPIGTVDKARTSEQQHQQQLPPPLPQYRNANIARRIGSAIFKDMLEIGVATSIPAFLSIGEQLYVHDIQHESQYCFPDIRDESTDSFLSLLQSLPPIVDSRHKYLIHWSLQSLYHNDRDGIARPENTLKSISIAISTLQRECALLMRTLSDLMNELCAASVTMACFATMIRQISDKDIDILAFWPKNPLIIFDYQAAKAIFVPQVSKLFTLLNDHLSVELERWWSESLTEDAFLQQLYYSQANASLLVNADNEVIPNQEPKHIVLKEKSEYIKCLLALYLLQQTTSEMIVKLSFWNLHLIEELRQGQHPLPPSVVPADLTHETPTSVVSQVISGSVFLSIASPPLPISEVSSPAITTTISQTEVQQLYGALDSFVFHCYSVLESSPKRQSDSMQSLWSQPFVDTQRFALMRTMLNALSVDNCHGKNPNCEAIVEKLGYSLYRHRIAKSFDVFRFSQSSLSAAVTASSLSDASAEGVVISDESMASLYSSLSTALLSSVNKAKVYHCYRACSTRIKAALDALDELCSSKNGSAGNPKWINSERSLLCLTLLFHELQTVQQTLLALPSETVEHPLHSSISRLAASKQGITSLCWHMVLLSLRGLRDVLAADKFFFRAQFRFVESLVRLIRMFSKMSQFNTMSEWESLFPRWALRILSTSLLPVTDVDVDAHCGSQAYKEQIADKIFHWNVAFNEIKSLFEKNLPQVVTIWINNKSSLLLWDQIMILAGKFNKSRSKCLKLYLDILEAGMIFQPLFTLTQAIASKPPTAAILSMLSLCCNTWYRMQRSVCDSFQRMLHRHDEQSEDVDLMIIALLRLLEKTQLLFYTMSRKKLSRNQEVFENAVRDTLRALAISVKMPEGTTCENMETVRTAESSLPTGDQSQLVAASPRVTLLRKLRLWYLDPIDDKVMDVNTGIDQCEPQVQRQNQETRASSIDKCDGPTLLTMGSSLLSADFVAGLLSKSVEKDGTISGKKRKRKQHPTRATPSEELERMNAAISDDPAQSITAVPSTASSE